MREVITFARGALTGLSDSWVEIFGKLVEEKRASASNGALVFWVLEEDAYRSCLLRSW
jgi:hypothetical protein